MPDLALCKNEFCPSRKHCFRFTAGQVYARFTVPAGTDRCEYYIPNRMDDTEAKELQDQLAQAKELLQEMADAVKEDPDYDDLHYKIISFLYKRRLDTKERM